jgi:hypothetical protein
VREINKHLRPISLTSAVSKLAEDFIVEKYVSPPVLSMADPAQFGGIPRSSATHALISMVHKWSEATDGTGNVVRTVLFDYRKAFDLVDHLILARKVIQLSVPSFVREQSLLMPGGGPEDISKLVVNFSWPLILSKYFFMAAPFRYNKFS